MPLFFLAGAEILLALLAGRIAWWILRSRGAAPSRSAPRAGRPDPSGTPRPARVLPAPRVGVEPARPYEQPASDRAA